MPVGHGADVGIGGGGIKRVAELPTPKRGSVVYVKAPYNLVTRERFNLLLTPANVPGGTVVGPGQVGYISGEVGALSPDNGDIATLITSTVNGEITLVLTRDAFEAFGSLGNLLVSFDGSSFQMNIDDPDGFESGGEVFYRFTSAGAVPGGDRWAAGTPVAVAVTNRGEGIGVTGSGIKRLGDSDTSGDRFDFPEGFYHVDPVNGEWTEGFGSADGGLPAVLLPEAGVSDADTRNHKWRGLLIGLAREDAGSDWRLRTAAGQEAVQPFVRWSDGTAALVATLEASRAVGAAGNAWAVSASFAGAGNPTSAGANAGAMVILLRLGPGATFAQAAAALNGVAGITAVVTGDGSRVLATSFQRFPFAGGLDAADMGVEMDVAGKIITLEHLTGHTQAEALAFLHERQVDEDTTLHAVSVGGTDTSRALAAAPLERPFVETYLHGSLPRHSAGDLAAVAAVAQANAGFLATFAARVRAVVEMIVPAWARAAEPPEELPDHSQAETQGLFSRAGALFWRAINEVPNAPGSAASVGYVLTVRGQNDRDYGWHSLVDSVTAIVRRVVPAWALQPEAPAGGGGGGGGTVDAIARERANDAILAASTADGKAVAARGVADANKVKVDRLTVFAQADLSPRGITGNDFPAFMALHLAGKIDPRPLAQIQVLIGGSPVATVNAANLLLPFNAVGGPGGIINLGLSAQVRANLKNAAPPATQFISVQIYYKFEGTGLAGSVEPDEIDTIRFGTNNNAYRLPGVPVFFERALGASAAAGNVPAGTYELVGYCRKFNNTNNRTRRYHFRFALADLGAAATINSVATRNPNGGDNDDQDISLSLAYVAATRTLIYSVIPAAGGDGGTPTIGAIRGRGFE